MHTIIYKSFLKPYHSTMDLDNIRMLANVTNNYYGITGCLYFSCPCIIQVLQGPLEPLLTLYTNILYDLRHYDLCLLMNQDYPVQLFPGCAMKGVQVEQIEVLADFIDIFKKPDPSTLVDRLMEIARVASDW